MVDRPPCYVPHVDLLVLGPLELRVDGASIPIRRGRPRRLFLSLLLRSGRPVGADTLIDELWGEEIPKNASNALQILVSYLRKTLASAPGAPTIDTIGGGYRLAVGDAFVDLHSFEQAVPAAAALAPADRIAALDHALGLWRGTPLPEVSFEDFAQGDIARINELRLTALEARGDAMLELGRHQELLGALRQLVIEEPLRERFHAQLALALYRSGRQADALRAIDTARDVLLDELGLDPGPELRSLQQAILEHDPALAAPPEIASRDRAEAPRRTAVREEPTRPNVPADDTVGRDEAIDKLRRLVADRRLVTLTGPGGTGKTRLAAEVTATAHVAWWADLSPVADAVGVLRSLSAATGAPMGSDDELADGLLDHLSGRDGILVIDTCEHVLDDVRHYVDRILTHTDVTVVATSRRPLRLRDELAWPVPPLRLPDPQNLTVENVTRSDAAELFRRRAVAVNPDFTITDRNAADVARICLLLDGLPLALELAAGHAGVLTPASIVRLLDDRFRLLVSDGHGRQQTLRATIEWSYDRLDADERAFLDRLAIFAGGFSLEAAVAVAGPGLESDGLATLLALANQSLVAVTGDDRFRLLDTIHAFVRDRLDRPQETEARARHAQWFRSFAEEANRHLRGADAAGWMDEVRAELPNLRTALEWSFSDGEAKTGAAIASSLSWFWSVEGLAAEGGQWLEAARAAAEPDGIVEAWLLTGRGMHAASLGDLATAVAECCRGAEIFRRHGDLRGEANALIYAGIGHWGLGKLDEAAALQDRAIAAFRELGDDRGFAISLALRSRTAADLGESTVADLLDAALPIARRVGDPHVIAQCLEQRSRHALTEGDIELARELATESLHLHEGIGHAEGTVASLHALGLALVAAGEVDAAADLHHRGLRLSHELEQPGGFVDGLECLALVASAQNDPARVIRTLAMADAFREQAGIPRPPAREAFLVSARADATAPLEPEELRRAIAAGRAADPASVIQR